MQENTKVLNKKSDKKDVNKKVLYDILCNQKNLLKQYISNVSNTNSLKEFIDSEVIKIKKALKSLLPKVNDKITKIKLSEAIDYTDTATKGKIVKDKHVVALMRYYELIKEIKNVQTRQSK